MLEEPCQTLVPRERDPYTLFGVKLCTPLRLFCQECAGPTLAGDPALIGKP